MSNETPAQKKLLALINDKKMATQIGSVLAEVAAELMDKYAEAAHWKNAFQITRDEMKVLAAVALRQLGGVKRLVITKGELQQVAGLELYVDTHEPGVRVYELRQAGGRTGKNDQVNQALESILRLQ